MFSSSIKDINRLISKGMSNIYFREKLMLLKLQLSKFKKFVSRPVFREFQLTLISLSFKTCSCNLKIRGLEAKARVAFLLS